MPFYSETEKIRPRVLKYLEGAESILDYGCGGDKIVPHATGIDLRPLPGVNVVTKNVEDIYDVLPLSLHRGGQDVIYSSHFLEHVKDDRRLMNSWINLLKPGGFLILYLPDDKIYDNSSNPEHLHVYTHDTFIEEFIPKFSGLEIVDHDVDYGDDRYSFFCVCRKRD